MNEVLIGLIILTFFLAFAVNEGVRRFVAAIALLGLFSFISYGVGWVAIKIWSSL